MPERPNISHKMIRDVYVLQRSGEVLVHKTFSKRGVDEAIFSGFYSALSAFAEELGHGGIETIQMGDVSFYYEHHKTLLIAVAADKSHNPKDIQLVLTEIKKRFLNKFANSLENWNGDVTSYQSFRKDIETIVTTTRSPTGENVLFTLPFALDGTKLKGKALEDPEINGDYVLDHRLELAAVHLLFDDIRKAENGLKPLNEGCYEFIAKLLWPIWIVGTPDGRMLLIDGLKLLNPQVARGFVPPANRFEALLKVNASHEYLAVMTKLTEEIRTAARSTPFDIHVIPAELASIFRQLCRLTNGHDQFGVQLPSQLNLNQANKEAEQFFSEAIQTHQEADEQWTQFRKFFQEDVKNWSERIQMEITTLEEHYETRRSTLKRDIDKALTEIAKQEGAALTKVDEWRNEEEQKLLAKLKTSLQPIDKQFNQQRIALDQFLANQDSSDLSATNFINELTTTLDTFNSFASNLRNHSKDVQKQIQQTQRAFADLDRLVADRKATVRSEFLDKEKLERARIDELEEERQFRLQETKERLDNVEQHATEIDGLIHDHITHSKAQLESFEQYLQDAGAPFPADLKAPIYIPLYIAGLRREEGTTQLHVIPPLIVPSSKGRSESNLGQRTAPVEEISKPVISFLKKPLEEAFTQNPKFAKQVSRFAPRHNLLTDSHVESLLYSGLHALWQSGHIPERTHTQVKLACIEAYRSTPES